MATRQEIEATYNYMDVVIIVVVIIIVRLV
jgi:hypothetical protein